MSEHFSFLQFFLESEKEEEKDDYLKSLLEADDDENGGTEEAPADDNAGAEDADTGEDADAQDEDFDIDTSVDNEGGDEGGGEETASDNPLGDNGGGGGEDGSSNSMSDGEQGANPINTKIFDTLSAEEQQIKIKELKRLYKELYTSVNDIMMKMQNMKLTEDNMEVMSRINADLYSYKADLMEYFTNTFDNKSYVENDIMFNQFLYYFMSIRNVIEEIVSTNEKIHDKNTTKRD